MGEKPQQQSDQMLAMGVLAIRGVIAEMVVKGQDLLRSPRKLTLVEVDAFLSRANEIAMLRETIVSAKQRKGNGLPVADPPKVDEKLAAVLDQLGDEQ